MRERKNRSKSRGCGGVGWGEDGSQRSWESLGWVIVEGWQRAGNEMERESLNNKLEKQDWEGRKRKDFKTRCYGLELYPLWDSLRTSVKIGIAFKCKVEKLLMSWNIFVNTAVLSSPFSTVSSQILSPLHFFFYVLKSGIMLLSLETVFPFNCWWKQSQQDEKFSVFLILFCIIK